MTHRHGRMNNNEYRASLRFLLRPQEEEKVPRGREDAGGHLRRAAGENLALLL